VPRVAHARGARLIRVGIWAMCGKVACDLMVGCKQVRRATQLMACMVVGGAVVVVSIHMHTCTVRLIECGDWGVDLVEQDTEASCGERGSPLPSTLTTPSFDCSSSAWSSAAGKLWSLSAAAMLRPSTHTLLCPTAVFVFVVKVFVVCGTALQRPLHPP
jgi:hypothetical protein